MKFFRLLKLLNIITSIAIFVLAIYILIHPLLPNIIFALSNNQFQGYTFQSAKSIQALGDLAKELPAIPNENWLVIPKMHVNALINEGATESTLNLGMWRIPFTSTPDKGGNTVIAAHRYLYTSGNNTFYQLDKLAMNDVVLVYWKGTEYIYEVYEIKEVTPQQAEVEYNTRDPVITLYTCTPLWTSEKRLVVKAKLQN